MLRFRLPDVGIKYSYHWHILFKSVCVYFMSSSLILCIAKFEGQDTSVVAVIMRLSEIFFMSRPLRNPHERIPLMASR